MESTGVYWIAPHEVLEGEGFEILRVDTRQLARVPGRDKKSDPSDCEWIQRLHSCGLLRGSFRPPEQVCMLRTLVRDKAILVAESGDLGTEDAKEPGPDECARAPGGFRY
jgi:transposase